MDLLRDILYGVSLKEVLGRTDIRIKGLALDSRETKRGFLFAAVRGTQSDGHQYIEQAAERGAAAILCEEFPAVTSNDVTYLRVEGTQGALGIIASHFFDNPSRSLKLIGVTGTNGKTTVATLLYHVFMDLGYSAGLISTIVNKVGKEEVPSTHTTPHVIGINGLLKQMAAAGCGHCFMEVSSHAISQGRVSGLVFSGAVFTNITHEHLDYHKTFQEYIRVKKSFFDSLPESSFALANYDDRNGKVMLQNTRASSHGFALKGMAEFKGKILEDSLSGLVMHIDGRELYSRLVGEFNASNLLAVYGAGALLGLEKMQLLEALSRQPSAEGRFDSFLSRSAKILGIVDYAHTPDALKNVLETIKKIRTGKEKVITLVGCGGDRDRTKRPVMAQVAATLSDQVIITSDNPRSEKPDDIIREMMAGILPHQKGKVLAITDRKEAIRAACSLASGGDIIILAGKGHEKYQEVKGVRHPFDDKKILAETFEEMNK